MLDAKQKAIADYLKNKGVSVTYISSSKGMYCLKIFTVIVSFFIPFQLNHEAYADDTVYEVGPGQAYTSLGTVPWMTLGPGDVVRIHWREEPYREKVAIHGRGTVGRPIVIQGVPGPDGDLPVISGENATTNAQFEPFFFGWPDGNGGTLNVADYGLIVIWQSRGSGDAWEYKPAFITIENLKLIQAHHDNTYTQWDDTTRRYEHGAGGVRVFGANNITIRNCEFTENGNGIFLNAYGEDNTTTRNTLIEGNHLYGNGNVGRDTEHNIYSQGINIVFQNNRIGRLRPGAIGSALKDRSVGRVIRFNWIESGARVLDLIEPEDADVVVNDPLFYADCYVYGNIFIDDVDDSDGLASAGSIVHYGGDTGFTELYPQGVLRFYNNTVVITADRSELWRVHIVDSETTDQVTEMRNNIIVVRPKTAGLAAANLRLLRNSGSINVEGVNWISEGYLVADPARYVPDINTYCHVNGTVIEGSNPGFTDVANKNYTLLNPSDCIDAGEALPAFLTAEHDVDQMYVLHQQAKVRTVINEAIDLGAFEYGSEQSAGIIPAIMHILLTE